LEQVTVLTQARDAMMEQVRQLKQSTAEGDVHLREQLDHALDKKEQLEDVVQVGDI
jgi:uncharacterized coiled-coil DUF342 family protein